MSSVEAKLRTNGKIFGILVDSDKAIAFREGRLKNASDALASEDVYSDIKKGMKASESDIVKAFGTKEMSKIAERIIKNGDLQIPSDYKHKQREEKLKQVIEFISRNAVDPKTNKPHSSERIKIAIEQSGINIDNRAVEEQVGGIIEKLKEVLPIKVETKKLKITIPSIYTGRAYVVIKDFKEKEDWLNNGDLICIINLPSGMQMEFYDKLNGITHGATIVEEMK